MYTYDNTSFNTFQIRSILENPIEEITTQNLISTAHFGIQQPFSIFVAFMRYVGK